MPDDAVPMMILYPLPIRSLAPATALTGSVASSTRDSSILRPLTAFVPFVAYASP